MNAEEEKDCFLRDAVKTGGEGVSLVLYFHF